VSAARKIWLTLAGKASHALDRMAAPPDTLDQSYQRQVNLLTKVQRELADVTASRLRVEHQLSILRQDQADVHRQLSLAARYDSLRAQEEKLTVARDRLELTTGISWARLETSKATSTGAAARLRAAEVCRLWGQG
jgi:phage shock protein A